MLVLGESAGDKKSRDFLELALNDLQNEKPKIFNADPVFIAARGVAELATGRTRMLEHEISIQSQDMASVGTFLPKGLSVCYLISGCLLILKSETYGQLQRFYIRTKCMR